jgi:pSer/pThr/pTyr-binding forkhead associated (FHA) protein
MSELLLTILRLGFLVTLWGVIFVVLLLMRRDLKTVERKSLRGRRLVTASGNTKKSKLSTVVVTDQEGASRRFALNDRMTIGRNAENSIVIDDDYTSGHHARISFDETGWIFTDLGSTNGSWVGRKRLDSELRVKNGTEIRVGRSTVVFEK